MHHHHACCCGDDPPTTGCCPGHDTDPIYPVVYAPPGGPGLPATLQYLLSYSVSASGVFHPRYNFPPNDEVAVPWSLNEATGTPLLGTCSASPSTSVRRTFNYPGGINPNHPQFDDPGSFEVQASASGIYNLQSDVAQGWPLLVVFGGLVRRFMFNPPAGYKSQFRYGIARDVLVGPNTPAEVVASSAGEVSSAFARYAWSITMTSAVNRGSGNFPLGVSTEITYIVSEDIGPGTGIVNTASGSITLSLQLLNAVVCNPAALLQPPGGVIPPTDPAVLSLIDQQARGGGCRGCGAD